MLANAKRKIRDFHIHFSNKNSIFLYRYLAHRSRASSTSTARDAPPSARIRRKTLLLTAMNPDTDRAVLPLPIPWKEETGPTRPLLAPPGGRVVHERPAGRRCRGGTSSCCFASFIAGKRYLEERYGRGRGESRNLLPRSGEGRRWKGRCSEKCRIDGVQWDGGKGGKNGHSNPHVQSP